MIPDTLHLDQLCNPCVRVVPKKDWSTIIAIWIPLLHHDYNNQLEQSKKIRIIDPIADQFGTVECYVLADNENYIPYLTTLFNPRLTCDQVIEQIIQAYNQPLSTQTILLEEKTIRTIITGKTNSGMLICLTVDNTNCIIDAYPLFAKAYRD